VTSVLVDGIGELVTNCPASADAPGIVANAANCLSRVSMPRACLQVKALRQFRRQLIHSPPGPRQASVTMASVLGVGALARITVLDAPSYQHLAYRPGVPIARLLVSP
jgi:hypothetical protein